MPCKEEDESGLAPAEDDDAAGRKIDREELSTFDWRLVLVDRFCSLNGR